MGNDVSKGANSEPVELSVEEREERDREISRMDSQVRDSLLVHRTEIAMTLICVLVLYSTRSSAPIECSVFGVLIYRCEAG